MEVKERSCKTDGERSGYDKSKFPMVSMKLFTDLIRPAALWPRSLTQPLTEISTRNICWKSRRPVRRADNLTTFMGPLF